MADPQPMSRTLANLIGVLQKPSNGHNVASKASSNSQPASPCSTCRGARWVILDVDITHPQFGRPQPCPDCLAPHLAERKLLRYFGESGVTGALVGMTFPAFTMRTADRMTEAQRQTLQLALLEAVEFAANPSGFLLLTGDPGVGKTHLAAAAIQQVLAQGRAALFVVVPDLLDRLRATFSANADASFDDRWNTVRTVDVLALDDFGTQSDTDWAREKLYSLINHRLNNSLPTIITSNWHLREFDRYHPRIASRLRTAVHVHIAAPDARHTTREDQS